MRLKKTHAFMEEAIPKLHPIRHTHAPALPKPASTPNFTQLLPGSRSTSLLLRVPVSAWPAACSSFSRNPNPLSLRHSHLLAQEC